MISSGTTGEWNFGPDHNQKHTVQEVIGEFAKYFNLSVEPWRLDTQVNPEESNFLLLDSTKAKNQLHWKNHLDFANSLSWSANWYQMPVSQAREITDKQIKDFFDLSSSIKI